MFVYMIVNTVNGKYYVGKTVSSDLQQYFRQTVNYALAGKTFKPYLYNAIRKYGREAFTIHLLMSTLKTNEQLCEQEKFLIRLFKANDPTIGYNISCGGDGATGTKRSAETRQKIGLAKTGARNPMFGKHQSVETRRKIQLGNLGKVVSPESRQKISRARIGMKFSAETCRRISEAKRKKGNN